MSGISVQNVGLTINKEIILENICLEVASGEIVGIVGRNGSGKSMLMKCICGFITPTEGEIRVNNIMVGKEADFPTSVGIIIETPGFIPYYSGYRNLKLLAELNGKMKREQIKESMLAVGLDPKLRRPVRKYSLGMRQRLGIAQAIMEKPEVMILDEPFNGLDSDGASEMRNLLLQYKKQGKAMLIASHISEDIEILCDRVIRLEHGHMATYCQ